jgi:hypothetical protein
MKPFDYVNAVSDSKKNLMVGTENDELAEKGYNPYLTNKSLSYHVDAILYANEMNHYASLDNKLQFDYYFHGLPKKKRFSKWVKKNEDESLELVSEWYGCSYSKATEILKIINKSTLDLIKQKLQKGGVTR